MKRILLTLTLLLVGIGASPSRGQSFWGSSWGSHPWHGPAWHVGHDWDPWADLGTELVEGFFHGFSGHHNHPWHGTPHDHNHNVLVDPWYIEPQWQWEPHHGHEVTPWQPQWHAVRQVQWQWDDHPTTATDSPERWVWTESPEQDSADRKRQRAQDAAENLRKQIRSRPMDQESEKTRRPIASAVDYLNRQLQAHSSEEPSENHGPRRADNAAEYLRQQLRHPPYILPRGDEKRLRAEQAAQYVRQRLSSQSVRRRSSEDSE